MPGKISFGDEEERARTELLAGAMIEDTASQHLLVGERVSHVHFGRNVWTGAVVEQTVQDLVLTFTNGVVIQASAACVDLRNTPESFRLALRAENERQRATAPPVGGIRAIGEALTDRPAPALGPGGDPVL